MDYDGNTLLNEELELIQKRPVISKKKPKKRKWPYIFWSVILFLILSFTGVVAYANYSIVKSETVLDGVSYVHADIGGLNRTEAYDTVSNTAISIINNTKINIECVNGIVYDFAVCNMGASFDADSEVDRLYRVGREGNYFKRAYDFYYAKIYGFDLNAKILYPDHLSDNIASFVQKSVTVNKQQPSYAITAASIIFFNGKDGISVKKEELAQAVEKVLTSLESGAEKYDLSGYVTIDEYERIDLDSIKDQVFVAAKDASYYENDKGLGTFEADMPGVGFDYELAKKNLEDDSLKYFVMPIYSVEADITLQKLKDELFADVIAEKTTTLAYNPPRTKNVTLAARKIDGTVLLPGQEFSFNNIVGERTYESGFYDAKIYVKDEMVDGVGGGICQVTSTLYPVALYADLEITERKNHRFTVSYIPLGQDATVMYGNIDFKFINNMDDPICINAKVTGNQLHVSITGKKVLGKEVELYSNVYNKKPYATVEKLDETLAPGTSKVSTHGTTGYTVDTYKKVTVNGEVISDEFLHKSVYVPCNEVLLVGPAIEPVDPGSDLGENDAAETFGEEETDQTSTPDETSGETVEQGNGQPGETPETPVAGEADDGAGSTSGLPE